MSKMTMFSVLVFVFLGIHCNPANSETTGPTLNDWKEMVEARLLTLERELDIQKHANAKLQAENMELRETCEEATHRNNKLLETLSRIQNVSSTEIGSHDFTEENFYQLSENDFKKDTDTKPVKRIVPSVDTDQVAFYSFISADTTHKLQLHQTLIYDHVKLNKGNGYHSDDGIFIVPVTGTYAFVWTLGVTSVGWVSSEIAINGQMYGRAFADGDHGSVASGTGFVIADVNAGDHVYIRMHNEGDPVLYGNTITSFSGWKL